MMNQMYTAVATAVGHQNGQFPFGIRYIAYLNKSPGSLIMSVCQQVLSFAMRSLSDSSLT